MRRRVRSICFTGRHGSLACGSCLRLVLIRGRKYTCILVLLARRTRGLDVGIVCRWSFVIKSASWPEEMPDDLPAARGTLSAAFASGVFEVAFSCGTTC